MNTSATLVLALALFAAPAPNLDPGPTAVLKDSRPDPKDAKANEEFVGGQVSAVLDPRILKVALKQPDLNPHPLLANQADPVKWLREHLKVTAQPDKGTLSIALPGFDANDQIVIVNAVAETYLEEDWSRRRELSERVLPSFERSRKSDVETLQGLLQRPAANLDARDLRWIEIYQEQIDKTDRLIKRCQFERDTPPRLQWHERAKGRR